jgi:hypothetical protein
VIAGVTVVDGVHLTTTPRELKYEVTFVGAPGSEYVFACAVGATSETSSVEAKASEPRLMIFLTLRVVFIPEC